MSSTSRSAGFAFAFKNDILTFGGSAQSTSIIAVPSFMVLWMRLAVAALDTNAVITMPPVALAVMAGNLFGSIGRNELRLGSNLFVLVGANRAP